MLSKNENATGKSQLRRFLRKAEVCERTGLPPSTIYEKMAAGSFPKNFHLTPRIVAWLEDEIAEWQRDRLAEREVA